MTPRSNMNGDSDTMSPPNESQKRKSDDGAPQPRAKRNRYISIAWCVETELRKRSGYANYDLKQRMQAAKN
jgi:hypothetical protein